MSEEDIEAEIKRTQAAMTEDGEVALDDDGAEPNRGAEWTCRGVHRV
jgi:hypothetical protein